MSLRLKFTAFMFACTAFMSSAQAMTADVTSVANDELEQIVLDRDRSESRNVPRVQCGLPGETLNICSVCSDTTSEESMRILRPMVGEKSHLAWHADWHNLRGGPAPLTLEMFESAKLKGLVPHEWSFEFFKSNYEVNGGTLAGENFFFMHRLMIKMVQMQLAQSGQPCFSSWKELPTSIEDENWPVPRGFSSQTARIAAQGELDQMRAAHARLRNPRLLKNISLNRLGELLEPRLHLQLHGFYRSAPACSPEARAQGFCDDLVPVATSPLNKHFWKIHGLVDDLVGDWLKANDYDEIAIDCRGRGRCYQWQATWLGLKPNSDPHAHAARVSCWIVDPPPAPPLALNQLLYAVLTKPMNILILFFGVFAWCVFMTVYHRHSRVF